ncbi:MAG: hypothetical protein OEU36_17580 [Gammaproteobacteria bacterium]|nr:hypothetical protein [Gammaproteobacteria bacterium]
MKKTAMTLLAAPILITMLMGFISQSSAQPPAGLPALQARVAALEALIMPSALVVNCPTDSLAAAVDQAAPGSVITISGRCTEPQVVVSKNGLTIEGATRTDGLDGKLRIIGAQGIVVRNLTVVNFGTAIDIREGASATIEDVTANADFNGSGDDGYAILITRQAYAQLNRVDASVESGGVNALGMLDGAVARTQDGRFVSRSNVSFDNTAIGLFRSCSLRMDGTPIIQNNNTLPPFPTRNKVAIDVLHTSNFRIQNDIARIDGNVIIGNNSAARIRRLGSPGVGPGTLNGRVVISGDSNLAISTRLSATVTGPVEIDDQSFLTANGPLDAINAFVFCNGQNLDGGVQNPDALRVLPVNCSLFP